MVTFVASKGWLDELVRAILVPGLAGRNRPGKRAREAREGGTPVDNSASLDWNPTARSMPASRLCAWRAVYWLNALCRLGAAVARGETWALKVFLPIRLCCARLRGSYHRAESPGSVLLENTGNRLAKSEGYLHTRCGLVWYSDEVSYTRKSGGVLSWVKPCSRPLPCEKRQARNRPVEVEARARKRPPVE